MTQILEELDFAHNQLKNATAHNVTAVPAGAKKGWYGYKTDDDTFIIKFNRGNLDILKRENHTGSITTSEVSNFAAAVRLVRLDEHAKPTAQVDFNGQRLRGLVAAANDDEPVRQAEFRQAQLGYDWKDSVELSTTGANISLTGTLTIDGVTSGSAKRILVMHQTAGAQNGIYLSNASGAWIRTNDGSQGALTSGAVVSVTDGVTQKGFTFRLSTPDPITVGTTAQTWVDFARPFVPVQGLGISITGATIAIDKAVVSRHVTGTIGDGVSTTIVWQHGLNNQWAIPYTCLAATGEKCSVDIFHTDANNYTIKTTLPLAVGAVKISAHG